MGIELPYRLLKDKTVDEPYRSEMFDCLDEIAYRDVLTDFVAHSQQAFEIIDFSGSSAYHRLESKQQAILMKRRVEFFS